MNPVYCSLTTDVSHDGRQRITASYVQVLFAIGRDPCTSDLHLERVGVRVNTK